MRAINDISKGATLALSPVLLQTYCANGYCGNGGGYGGMMGQGFGNNGSFFFLGGIIHLVFWVLIIGAVIYLVRYVVRERESKPGSRAIEILKQRYAKGEISKEEFDQKKKEIEGM